LAIALAPSFLYIWITGWRGVMAAKGKIAAISIIVILHLLLDIWMLANYFDRFR
jgi:hypothetical protein